MARLDVTLSPAAGHELPSDLKAVTIDVGVGGARCACNRPLEPQTILHMTLTLVGGDLRQPATIDGEVRVRRCAERRGAPEIRRYEVALEFIRLAPQDKQRLRTYLNSL